MIIDHLSLLEARNEIQNAKNLAWEWSLTFDNLTVVERNLLTGQIRNSVNSYEWIVRDSYVGDMVHQFKVFGQEDDYFLANSSIDGFNYSISKLGFEDYDSKYNLSHIVDIDVFLKDYKFKNATDLVPLFTGNAAHNRSLIADLDSWTNLFRTELYEIQNRINNYTTDLASFERSVSYYTFGITAITITTILATAMANRISDKESEKAFSPVKAKVLANDKWLITKTKKWPMIMLLFALILSIAGLVIPPIIGILT